MSTRTFAALAVASLIGIGTTTQAIAALSDAQRCESAVELATAKYAQCRLKAESKFTKKGDGAALASALASCATKLQQKYARADASYGGSCPPVESESSFEAYLNQCTNDVAAAAAGAALPDYVGDLASCNSDLGTCNGDLAACNTDLATAIADLATCEGDLAACEALPPARLLKTGQTTAYGAGSDGDLEVGVAQGYVDNGDGTITDTSTGLMWEKKSDDGSIHDKDNVYSWSGASFGSTNVLDGTAATTFLAALNAGGGFAEHTDWRLPNRKELESLVNLEAVAPATFPEFNTGCAPACTVLTCSCTVPSGYWSSSTYVTNLQGAWDVYFNDGDVSADSKDFSVYVRAVRGGS